MITVLNCKHSVNTDLTACNPRDSCNNKCMEINRTAPEFEIIRFEPWRSEFRFVARRHGRVIADTSDFDTAMSAFKNSGEREAVTLIISADFRYEV